MNFFLFKSIYIYIVYIIEKLWNQNLILLFGQNFNKISNIKNDVFGNVLIEIG